MSVRTIIEINHDYGHAIQNDPIGFALTILGQVRASNDPETITALRHYGVRVVQSVHHSTDRKVVIEGEEYPL